MLRASSHLPSISAAPALSLSAFTFSSIPILNISSSPPFSRNPSTFSLLFHTFLPKTQLPTSKNFPFLSSRKLPSMAGLPCPQASASFSAESSSGEGREILVQHLLLKEDDLKLLVELQHRSIQGEDLSDLAVEYSICPSKEEGGMLGWVSKGQMVPEFEEAVFKAPLNKVSRCKTKFGWHLFQVLSERKAALLEDIQPEELYAKMQDPSFFEEAQLIDVREPDEVAQASLPGFKVLPLRQFGSWGPEITSNFDPQKDTYVMCHHGMRSLQVAKWLQTQGFTKIYNLSGGIHAYAVKVDSSIPMY